MLAALLYGLARFAYGLFLPQIREELSLGMVAAGWVAGSAFAAYCQGIILAFCSSATFSAVACLAIAFRPQADVADTLRTGNL